MARVSASGSRIVAELSSFSVTTMAAIFSGGIGMKGRPTRLSGVTTGIGIRFGR